MLAKVIGEPNLRMGEYTTGGNATKFTIGARTYLEAQYAPFIIVQINYCQVSYPYGYSNPRKSYEGESGGPARNVGKNQCFLECDPLEGGFVDQ